MTQCEQLHPSHPFDGSEDQADDLSAFCAAHNIDVLDICEAQELHEQQEDDEAAECPWCKQAVNYPLGGLGRLLHYTCRQCGGWYNREVT